MAGVLAIDAGVFDVTLFGTMRLRHGNDAFALAAPPKVTPLLAALLIERAHAIPRERLAFMLWPDESAGSARANLRRHLLYLSRALPDVGVPWLVADARTVRWNAAMPLQLDIARFEDLLQQGRRREAAELYDGDLLVDLDEEWLEPERARLRALHLDNLKTLIDLETAERRHAAAAQWAQRLLHADPWREDALRALMTARFELGDRAGALAAYDAFEHALADEIGSDPLPETRALRARVAVDEPVLPNLSPRRPDAPAPLADFVGRDDEMHRLRALYRNATFAHGSVAFIVGEAGIGKSRLLAAFRGCVEREGATFASGATSAPEHGPYEAVLEALQTLVPAIVEADLDDVWIRTLGTALPAIAAAYPQLEPPPTLDPRHLRDRLFEAIVHALEAVARRAPLVLTLEDLHWAGASTCALVGALAEGLAQHAVVLVATYRDDLAPAHPLRELRRRIVPAPEHLALRPFGVGEVGRFVAGALGAERVPEPCAARLHEQSDGNPFALGQVLRNGLESGAIRVENRTVVADVSGLRTAVDHVLADRLDRLSMPARAVAEVAAVVGGRFGIELVARASGLGESRTASALAELLDRQLAHDAGKGDFAFVHHSIADAIYARSDAEDRRRRHQRIAETMELLYGEAVVELAGELAHHWAAAGNTERAVPYELRAAARALGLFAHDEVRERLARVLEHEDDASVIAQALLLREELERRAGDRAAQERDLSSLEQNGAAIADPELRCEVLRRRAALAHLQGAHAVEQQTIAALHAAANALGSSRWQTVALLVASTAEIDAGRFDSAQAALDRARELGFNGDPALAVDGWCNTAAIAVHRAEFDLAETLLDTAWDAAGSDEALRYRVLDQRFSIARARERFDRVHALARELLAYARRIGDRRAEMFNHRRLANAAMFLFGIAEAREHYAIAETMAQTLGSPRDRAATAICQGVFAYGLGDVDSGRHYFQTAHAIAESEEDAFSILLARINLACASYAGGSFADAVRGAEACIEPARAMRAAELEAAAYCTRGSALRGLGRAREAVEQLASGVAMQRAAGLRWSLGQDLAELTFARLAAGDVADAASAIDELSELAESSYLGLTHSQFMLRAAAEAATASGDLARGERLFARAKAAFQARLARIPDEPTQETFRRAWFNAGLTQP